MTTQKILAIDDSPEIHKLLRARLSALDVELEHATSGEEGLRKASAHQPDLILLDVIMPGTGGFDVCRRLKAEPDTAAIPVIFLTAASDVDQKVMGFDVGAVDYIPKPFHSAELQARVRSALRTKRYFDMLSQRAMIDGLTGLWNRTQFDQRLLEEVAASKRYDRPLSLILLDLDHFKSLNDTHGHPFGDEALQAVGELLQSATRTCDWPCRYGGEEFAVILRETDHEGALVIADRLRERIAILRLKHDGQSVCLTASFGVASSSCCPNPARLTREWFVASADSALYQAKQSGRNRVCLASDDEAD